MSTTLAPAERHGNAVGATARRACAHFERHVAVFCRVEPATVRSAALDAGVPPVRAPWGRRALDRRAAVVWRTVGVYMAPARTRVDRRCAPTGSGSRFQDPGLPQHRQDGGRE